MKMRILLLILAAFATLTGWGQQNFKLMTYNIRNANGMDDVRNFDRTASVIAAQQPDLVAVQEVDSLTGRSGGKYVLGEIAKRTGLKDCFAAAIDYDGGKYGIGILSKESPKRSSRISLPGREEKRALLVAEFKDFIFCCVHLSLTEEDRLESLRMIKEIAAGAKKPFFIAGDMNDLPNSQFIKELERDFTILSDPNQPTYPASEPTETIDYIAIYKGNVNCQTTNCLSDISAVVVAEPAASDHRPIVVTLCPSKTRQKTIVK